MNAGTRGGGVSEAHALSVHEARGARVQAHDSPMPSHSEV
jgi:hypothetical protein